MNTRFFVSPDLPVTHDAEGFEELNWTEFGRKGGKMNITKVFRTSDGEIFDTKAEAEQYVTFEKQVHDISGLIYTSTAGIDLQDCREMVRALFTRYDVVAKCTD